MADKKNVESNEELNAQICILPLNISDTCQRDDQITNIINQLLSREKENENFVQQLKKLIEKEAKKQIQTCCAIKEITNKTVELAEKNDAITSATKDVAANLNNVRQFLNSLPENQDKELELTLSNMKTCLKEATFESRSSKPHIQYLESKILGLKNGTLLQYDECELMENAKEKRQLLKELQETVQNWLHQVVATVSEYQSEQPLKKISTFPKGVFTIIDAMNKSLLQEVICNQLQEEKEKLEIKKAELHDRMSSFIIKRKCVKEIAPKIRHELGRIRQSRISVGQLPKPSDDLIEHLENLYAYGNLELMASENQLNEIENRCQTSKVEIKANEKIQKIRISNETEKNRMFEYRLDVLKRENLRLTDACLNHNEATTKDLKNLHK